MIDQRRLQNRIDTLKAFTSTPGAGVTRFSFSAEDAPAREAIRAFMEEAGLRVIEHPSGNIIGRMAGRSNSLASVVCGSHFDTVRNGGAYDGICGIVTAIEAAMSMREDGFMPKRPLTVVAFVEEEGGRFGRGLLGSSMLLGLVSPADLHKLTDSNNISAFDAMWRAGFTPDQVKESAFSKEDLAAYVELHIEQGPVLEAERKQIGVVTRINSMNELMITVEGRADHAGTTPMNMRRDALRCAADLIGKLYEIAAYAGNNSTVTVGHMDVLPGSANVVPDQVSFTVDYRCQDNEVVAAMRREIEELAAEAGKGECSVSIRDMQSSPAISMDEHVKELVRKSAEEQHLSWREMVSGAGHDAQIFAALCPTGMIFIPSKGGRSHCPEEFTYPEEIAAGASVLEGVLKELCSE